VIAVYWGIQTGPDVSAFNKLPCCKMTDPHITITESNDIDK
jgi:hypothetical protein